jgi:hypothetical protein
MPDTEVNVVFSAETSQMTQAFSKLNSELESGATHTVNWTNIQKQNAQAAEFMSQANYKTAASFKPATAEMRGASVAVEDLGKKGSSGLGAFRGTMRALRFDIFEVVAALGIMVKAIDEAGKAEASQRHLANQGISAGASGQLSTAARVENFEPHQYDDAAISLKVAGVAADDLVNDVTELGKASRISGVPFEKLVDTAASMTEELRAAVSRACRR